MNHPNASRAVITGAVATCIVYVVEQFGLEMEPAVGMAFATVAIAAVLFVGRRNGAAPG